MKRICMAASMALFSLAAMAQDEAEATDPVVPATSVWNDMAERYYLSPMFSYGIVDSGRNVDSGPGAALAIGRAFGPFGVELAAQYARHDHESGAGKTKIQGLGANVLFFPSKKQPGYLLLGAGYGDVQDHPGGVADYNPLMLNLGGGYWWQPFQRWLPDLLLRTEAVYRLDAHNDRRTGETVRNGRKDFNDLLLNVGLAIPVGGKPAPMVPPPAVPEPVAVVPVMDADGDGVADEADQCPDTAAGGTVDASGCTAAPVAEAAVVEPSAPVEAATPVEPVGEPAQEPADVAIAPAAPAESSPPASAEAPSSTEPPTPTPGAVEMVPEEEVFGR